MFLQLFVGGSLTCACSEFFILEKKINWQYTLKLIGVCGEFDFLTVLCSQHPHPPQTSLNWTGGGGTCSILGSWHGWFCCRCVRADGDCAASGNQRAYPPCAVHEQDGPSPADAAAGCWGSVPDFPAHHWECQRHRWHLFWGGWTHGKHCSECLGAKLNKETHGGSRVHRLLSVGNVFLAEKEQVC